MEKKFRQLINQSSSASEQGPTATEYSIFVGLLAMVSVGSVGFCAVLP